MVWKDVNLDWFPFTEDTQVDDGHHIKNGYQGQYQTVLVDMLVTL